MNKILFLALAVLCSSLLPTQSAYAHLMMAQHGTVNFTEKGAFFIVSVPASAFGNLDDDHSGHIEQHEVETHRTDIEARILKGFILRQGSKPCLIEGLLINAEHRHHDDQGGAQIVITGRFKTSTGTDNYRAIYTLFGQTKDERSISIRFRRGQKTQRVVFKAKKRQRTKLRLN